MTREKLLKSPAYWFEYEQNELFRQVTEYMERENINQTELAAKLNVSKGYVSQILNGNFNYTLKKLIELCLAIGLVPEIKFTKVEDVIKKDAQLKAFHDNDGSIKAMQVSPLRKVSKTPSKPSFNINK
jgi:transcriptional regulator with XRE-family HTH domain